jgi:hypothetical protein
MKTDNDRVFVDMCINWFYSYTNYIKTKLEEDYSIASFQQWIAKSNEVPPVEYLAATLSQITRKSYPAFFSTLHR